MEETTQSIYVILDIVRNDLIEDVRLAVTEGRVGDASDLTSDIISRLAYIKGLMDGLIRMQQQ